MNRSTNINELPNIQQINQEQNKTEENMEEDNTIHEVLQEIENENFASQNGNPPIPQDVLQQNPSKPQKHQQTHSYISQNPPSLNTQNMTNTSNYSIDEMLKQNNLNNSIENYLNNLNKNNESKSLLQKIQNNIQKDYQLFLIIISSFVLLNLDFVKNFINDKLLSRINVSIPKLNLILPAIIQSIIILVSRIIL
jgi:hypothetical protein